MSAASRGPAAAGWLAGPAVSGILGRFLPNSPRRAVLNECRRRGLLAPNIHEPDHAPIGATATGVENTQAEAIKPFRGAPMMPPSPIGATVRAPIPGRVPGVSSATPPPAARNGPRRRGFLLGALALAALPARAAPPAPGSEDAALMAEFSDWITTQHAPGGGWCCDLSDGRPLFEGEWRVERGGYRILISRRHWPDAPEAGLWIDVPADRLTAASPLGLPVAWWTANGPRLWCFAPVGGF